MGKYKQWMDSAAEEAISESIKSSMDLCSQIQKDEIDHDKIESLQYCWQTIHKSMDDSSDDQPKKETISKKNSYLTSTGNFIVSAKPKTDPDKYITAKA